MYLVQRALLLFVNVILTTSEGRVASGEAGDIGECSHDN